MMFPKVYIFCGDSESVMIWLVLNMYNLWMAVYICVLVLEENINIAYLSLTTIAFKNNKNPA